METKHIQGKVVAVCGKGGVGKTAFTTMLTKVLKDDPERVCNFLWAARSRLIDVGGDSVTK